MKFDNFILEQDLGDASINDIRFEQTVAELNVVSSLLDYYDKQEAIVEYLDHIGIDPDIYMESEETVKNFFKGLGNKLKDGVDNGATKAKSLYKDKSEKIKIWFKNLIIMIKTAVDQLIDTLSHVNFKALAKRVEKKYSDNIDFSNKINPMLFWTISHASQYTKELLEYRENYQSNKYADATKKLKEKYDQFCRESQRVVTNDAPGGEVKLTKYVLIDKLKKADTDQKNIVGIRTLLRKLRLEDFDLLDEDYAKNILKDVPVIPKDKDQKTPSGIAKSEIRKIYEDFAKAICKCYLDASKEIKKLIKAIGPNNEDVEPTDMSNFVSKNEKAPSLNTDGSSDKVKTFNEVPEDDDKQNDESVKDTPTKEFFEYPIDDNVILDL